MFFRPVRSGPNPDPRAHAVPFFLKPAQLLSRGPAVSEARATVRGAYIGALYAPVWSGCQCTGKFKIRGPHGLKNPGEGGRGPSAAITGIGAKRRVKSPSPRRTLKCTGATGSNLWRLYAPCVRRTPRFSHTRYPDRSSTEKTQRELR